MYSVQHVQHLRSHIWEGKIFEMIFLNQRLDLEGLSKVPSGCPHKYILQSDQLGDPSNVSPM